MSGPRRDAPDLGLPLPEALAKVLEGERPQDGDNLGLWLDKFVHVDKNDKWALLADLRVQELERLFCPQKLDRSPRAWRSKAAEDAVARLAAACTHIYGPAHRSFRVAVEGRLLVDYGRPSALEGSFSLHPVLGCPRIPGSALKGLLRASMRAREAYDVATRRALLGAPDARVDPPSVKQQRGRLVLHDALPENGEFTLAVDVLTPHMGKYYVDRDPLPPADWLSPVPHTFLTVVNTTFRVFVGLLPERGSYWAETAPPDGDPDLAEIEDLLCEALELDGIGAKRAAGYGRLRRVP